MTFSNAVVYIELTMEHHPMDVADYEASGYIGPGWYHYDETWAYIYGPFKTRQEATKASIEYANFIRG